MTKKMEYALPFYYCGIARALDLSRSECVKNPNPDCRDCQVNEYFKTNPNKGEVLKGLMEAKFRGAF